MDIDFIYNWKWWLDGEEYQSGYNSHGFDKDGYAPDGLDSFGFDRSGHIDICGGLSRKDFDKTPDYYGNLILRTTPVIVVSPRVRMTYFDEMEYCYRFLMGITHGSDFISYKVFDDLDAYNAYIERSKEPEPDYSDLYALYDEGFGGSDWGI